MLHLRKAVAGASIFISLVSTNAPAGFFDNPKNLQVLPENISGDELGQIMRGFAIGTGNRCSACHVGKIEADLSTYDFALDEMEKKVKARQMIKLMQDINARLAEAFPDSTKLVTVSCATCHRGQSKPEMIEDVLAAHLRDEGLDPAVARYRELRERYYGSYTFDFSERMLMGFAENLGARGELEAALRFVNLNLEYYPQSSRSYVVRAGVLLEQGDASGARRDYETALQLEPESAWIKARLDELD